MSVTTLQPVKILVLVIGPPGSGKTTYCRTTLKEYYHVSQDEMGQIEHRQVFLNAIERGERRIVIDRMNFNVAQRARYIIPAVRAGYKIKLIGVCIDSNNFNKCFDRAINRESHPTIAQGDMQTLSKVLHFFYNAYEPPKDFEYDEWEVLS